MLTHTGRRLHKAPNPSLMSLAFLLSAHHEVSRLETQHPEMYPQNTNVYVEIAT